MARSWCILLLMPAVALMLQGCGQRNHKRNDLGDERVSVLAAKHNALTDWGKSIISKKPKDFRRVTYRGLYSAELEALIDDGSGRPFLFFASVKDIEKREKKYFLHLRNFLDDLLFDMECSEQLARRILDQDESGEYAFVSRASLVQLADETTDRLLITGSCLDLEVVGKYELRQNLGAK